MISQIRVFIVLYAAIGMIGSYMSGYMLIRHRLQDTRIELMFEKGKVKEANARAEELRARALDRDLLEHDLRECLVLSRKQLDLIEDIKWQMNIVMNTCPGRERPPKTPRP